jgi:hypothetical protein
MKRIIQICSLFGLLVLFTAVSASAQVNYGSDVEIPFAFNVAGKSYDAGHYIIKVSKLPNGTATLTIEDTKSDKAQTVFLSDNGDEPGKEVKLVFDKVAGQRFLSKVQTPVRSFAVAGNKSRRDREAQIRKSTEAVSTGGATSF